MTDDERLRIYASGFEDGRDFSGHGGAVLIAVLFALFAGFALGVLVGMFAAGW